MKWLKRVEKRSKELDLKEKELERLSLELEERSKMIEAGIEKRPQGLQSSSLDMEERCEIVAKEKAEAISLKQMVEASIEKKWLLELELKEELQSLSLELDQRVENFEAEKSKAGDLKKTMEEYTEELSSKRNQLTTYERELVILENKLGEVKVELTRCCSEAEKARERNREIEEETDGRKKGLASILDQIKESGKQFVSVDEQLEYKQSLLTIRSLELVAKEKELECVKESIKVSTSELEQKQKMVQSLRNYITICGQKIDSKSKELSDIQKMIEQQTGELGVLNDKLGNKEERYREIVENICRSSSKMEEKAKEIKVVEAEANDLYARSQRLRKDVEDKEKELNLLKNQIELEDKRLSELKREVEEETNGKKKDLELILSEIEESSKKHNEILETIRRSSSDMEEKVKGIKVAEAEANELNLRSHRFRKEVEDKEKELVLHKNQIESEDKRLSELKRETLEEVHRKKEELEVILSKTEECGKELVAVDEQLESQRRLLEIRSEELVSKDVELECVGESRNLVQFDLEVKEKKVQAINHLIKISGEQLDLKCKALEDVQKLIESEEMKLIQRTREMEEETDGKKKDLELILSNIEKSGKQLDLTSEELGEVRKLIEEERKRLCDMQNQQPSIQSEQEPDYEDSLTHQESSASLAHDGVSRALKVSPNPAELVLKLVQEYIREGSSLEEDIMVLFCDGLAKLQLPYESQLQPKVREVATHWKEMITTEAPKSSLETLAFLLFIVAYELKELINLEERTLLASSIAQYEQAPTLFNSLGLTLMIPEFVKELIKKRQYIPAVRFICSFKLNRETSCSPSELLKEEIINLRQSALGKRPVGSSQAKYNDDAGRLRALLELVADYNLQVDLPGDLVAKLFVQREQPTPLARCS